MDIENPSSPNQKPTQMIQIPPVGSVTHYCNSRAGQAYLSFICPGPQSHSEFKNAQREKPYIYRLDPKEEEATHYHENHHHITTTELPPTIKTGTPGARTRSNSNASNHESDNNNINDRAHTRDHHHQQQHHLDPDLEYAAQWRPHQTRQHEHVHEYGKNNLGIPKSPDACGWRTECRLVHETRHFARRLLGELVGTFILVFTHSALRISTKLNQIDEAAHGFGAGLTLVGLIYSLGEVGGAHFNPTVTLAFVLRGVFPLHWLPLYWISQFGGACWAAAFIKGFYQEHAILGTSSVKFGFPLWQAMWFEAILTWILVQTILSLGTRGSVVGPHAALAVGATVALGTVLGVSCSSGSMNPFRSLGPAIVNGGFEEAWVFVAGPFIGMLIAVTVVKLLSPRIGLKEYDVAQGEGEETEK